MKHKEKSKRRQKELLELYQTQQPKKTHFKITQKSPVIKKEPSRNEVRPLSLKNLLFSLLLTFVIISVQWYISKFI